jgi:DtxR family Mn-dependent transcriptional regulator
VRNELSSTLEDYLETICRIESEKRVVRPRDICEAQGVAPSTVTAALQSLARKGLVNYEPYEFITLTEDGRWRAEKLVMRHRIIRDFLENILGLPADQGDATACGMEHAVAPRALERFVCFLAFMRRHCARGPDFMEEFREFVSEAGEGRACKECVEQYMESLRTETR